MFHSNEFCIGTSPYSLNATDLQRMKIRLRKYLKWYNSLPNSNYIKLFQKLKIFTIDKIYMMI